MLDFKPPQDNELVIGLCRTFLPQILKYRCNDLQVQLAGDGLERLKKHAGQRMMICPNHSFRHDPEVMFALSVKAHEAFNFVAAREVFDYNNGWNGFLLQKMGVYSVVRGAADRESFKTTRTLLAAGKKKLVLFPEGEISWQNDHLLPLETGAVQLSYWALDEMRKQQIEAPLYILPVALKYVYRKNICDSLQTTVTKLESELGIDAKGETSLYARVRGCAMKVLGTLEKQYNLKPAADAPLNERMKNVKESALRDLAEVLDVELPPLKASYLDWVRVLRNAMDDYIYTDTKDMSDYEKKIHDERAGKIRGYYRDLDRVIGFIAVYDGYLSPPATQERVANVVEMLEQEVFGEKTIKGPRLVTIEIGESIDLAQRYDEYKKSKKTVIEAITQDLSRQIHGMLDTLENSREHVYVT